MARAGGRAGAPAGHRAARTVQRAAVAVPAALLVAAGLLFLANDAEARRNFDPVALLVGISYSSVGALVVLRRPAHPTGWLLLFVGTCGMLEIAAAMYGSYGLISAPGAVPLAGPALWSSTLYHVPALSVLGTALLLTFPTGRLPSRRWRPVAAVACFGGVTVVLAWVLNPEPSPQVVPAQPSPLAAPALFDALTPLWLAGLAALAAAVLASLLSLLLRLRAAEPQVRQQLFWVVLAGGLSALSLFALPTLPDRLVDALTLVVLPLLPVAFGVAVVRHRLLDIEVVLRRTVVYAGLAGFVGGVYLAVVTAVGLVIGPRVSDDARVSVVATAVVALTFAPARRRIERSVDRLLFGPRTTPYETLAATSRRLRDTVSVDEVLPHLAESIGHGLRAGAARASVQLPDGRWVGADWPDGAGTQVLDVTVPVLVEGQVVGELAASRPADDPFVPADLALLKDVAAQAGPALRSVRLTEQLSAELARTARYAEALQASRTRVVEAADTERRRIERNLHDGAQHHLVALAMKAGMARRDVADHQRTAVLLDELADQARDALAALRELARGVYPPALRMHGLVPALRTHVAAVLPGASFSAAPAAHARFDERLEAAVYFCCVEALQNCAKHARGASVRVVLEVEDGSLCFRVSDEGPGFDVSTRSAGSGLTGLEDRLAAVGGELQVCSAEGRGTTVVGRVPVAAPAC